MSKPNKKTTKLRWVVGHHACLEALRVRPRAVREIATESEDLALREDWGVLLHGLRAKPQKRKASFFNQLSAFGHQGVAVGLDESPEAPDVPEGLVLFLDQLNDPSNLGAILRTSWLMNVQCVYIPEHSSVRLNATACKIAAGGAEHVPVERVHFATQMNFLKEQGYWSYGFAEGAPTSLFDVKFDKKSMLIMGSEGKGIRKSTANSCDELLFIPQVSSGSSYNVSVAAGLGLSEYARQFGV